MLSRPSRPVLAALTALAVLGAPATAVLAAPAHATVTESREEVEAAKEEVAQLGREVEAASAEYTEVEKRLEEQRARVESAQANVEEQSARIADMEDQLVVLAVETYKRGGIDPKLELLATGDLSINESTDTLGVVAGRKSASLGSLRDAQLELRRLRHTAQQELSEVEALEADLAERRAAIEAKLEGAKDALAVAEREHQERVAAAEARAADQASRSGRAAITTDLTSGGRFAVPTPGPMTSPFGYRVHPVYGDRRLHKGMDIGASCGTPVVAAESGVVQSASWNGSYGNIVVVDHGGGLSTAYAHLQGAAKSGGSVAKGEVIGWVGSTGLSTGCHLHFEVREGGTQVDPMGYL
ncbi:M23 family metallopeptidase [Aquipuribacter nitratireducens]|uniref:Peptidoglycan DD-metalloendopeptidase family protein n=1 Tax=Aquipuribacter nitratireducens TaxID=650104 RepID=A0ABW0GN56_9MICO